MFVMLTMTNPPNKSLEVAKGAIKDLQENPLPPFIKLLHIFIVSSLEVGMKAYQIYELDAGKEAEGLLDLGQRMAKSMNIEGFRFEIRHVLTAEEAAPMLGLEMP